MTKTQLEQSGYRTGMDVLPSPVGCYRELSSFKYVPLYDPGQAIRKRESRRPRTTICVSDIFWPYAWQFLLDAVAQKAEPFDPTLRHFEDVLQMTFHLVFFDQAEIERVAGPCLHLIIPPLVLHRSYLLFLNNHIERTMLMRALIKVYEYQRASL